MNCVILQIPRILRYTVCICETPEHTLNYVIQWSYKSLLLYYYIRTQSDRNIELRCVIFQPLFISILREYLPSADCLGLLDKRMLPIKINII